MPKVKHLSILPLFAFSGAVIAETVPAPVQESVATVVSPQAAGQAVGQAVSTVQENTPTVAANEILPQLSLAHQQARAKAAEAARIQAERATLEAQVNVQKLREAEARVQQTIGNNKLMLADTTTKIYLDNDFSPMWSDQAAERAFLKEYALFVASGVSNKSAQAFNQLANQPAGLARDILLTDSFLDYLYYNKNVYKNANHWLYQMGSYQPKAPALDNIAAWVSAVKHDKATTFVKGLVPRNHIYVETTNRVLASSPAAADFYKLALNAQRLRIIPSFDNGIFVNIPSYQLYYFRDGKLALESKVIVGRDDRRTPVMYSKLSNVVVNPPWNAPVSLINKDLVPKMKKDPSYVTRRSYEILDSKGNVVNPHSINWSQYNENTKFPYRIRQKAGDDSALGRYKFNMPSSDAIYLHDTPNRGLFSKTDRALSSGCIRVAKSDELASILLKEAGWTMAKKEQVLASKKTTSANIRSDNPVYLYYVTTWVEGGRVQTLPDIYKYDSQINKVKLSWNAVKNVI